MAGTKGKNTKSAERNAVSRTTARKSAKAAYKPPKHYAVPKSDGDGAAQAWIGLLPDWQSALLRRVDAVVTQQMPEVHKAVKWHGAWYGVPGKGWFLAIGSFKAHLKLVFFDGASLSPPPPVALAAKPRRALDIREDDALDEKRLAGWMRQARRLRGWGEA